MNMHLKSCSIYLGLALLCSAPGQLHAQDAIHIPRHNTIPLTVETKVNPSKPDMAPATLFIRGPFFQLKALGVNEWKVESLRDGKLRFTHPYISGAEVTYTLFPADLFFPDDASLDWKSMYIRGLNLEYLTAEIVPPNKTFVVKHNTAKTANKNRASSGFQADFKKPLPPEQEDIHHPAFPVQSINYRLETLRSPAPLYCRDYFVQLFDGKELYCMHVSFKRTEPVAKTILDDMFKLFFRFRLIE